MFLLRNFDQNSSFWILNVSFHSLFIFNVFGEKSTDCLPKGRFLCLRELFLLFIYSFLFTFDFIQSYKSFGDYFRLKFWDDLLALLILIY